MRGGGRNGIGYPLDEGRDYKLSKPVIQSLKYWYKERK